MSQPLIMSFRPDAAEMCLGIHPDGLVKDLTRRLLGRHYFSDVQHDPFFISGIGEINTGKCDKARVWDLNRRPPVIVWEVGKSIAIKPGRTAKAVGRVMCTGLRIEHVQDITEEDARREGVEPMPDRLLMGPKTYCSGFETVWNLLYPSGPKSWDANPLVVVFEFRPLREGEE